MNKPRARRLVPCLAAAAIAAAPCWATTIMVTTTDDDLGGTGHCSLRAAVSNANTDSQDGSAGCAAGSGDDTIVLPAGTYTLALTGSGEDGNLTGDLDITAPLTIEGSGADVTIVDGSGIDRVFHVLASSAVIRDLTLRGGRLTGAGGAGIEANGSLQLASCRVTGNAATVTTDAAVVVGGVFAATDLEMVDSEVSDNTATGTGLANSADGAIWCGGACTLDRVTVAGNAATVTATTAFAVGGLGSGNAYAVVDIRNSTISDNSATADLAVGIATGGVATGGAYSDITLANTTIAGNSEAGSIVADILVGGGSSTVTVSSSIVVGTCSQAVISQGGNLESPGDTCGLSGPGDQVNVADPLLAALAWNGGPTRTRAPEPDSPAVDQGNDGACEAVDQRSEARPQDGDGDGAATCDAGAFEVVAAIFADGFATGATGKWSNGTANYLVDVGGSAPFVDGSGNTWLADLAWAGSGYGYEGGGSAVVVQPIANTDDDALYQSERWGLTGYHFDLPPATYSVTLHFVELGFSDIGQRVFDVSLEGVPVLDNFDIFLAARGEYVAYPRTFEVAVSDGTLDIGFTDVVDVSQVAAIAIR